MGPVLANVFVVELENSLIPVLGDKVSLWQRYVDDTFTFIKQNEIENVKGILNQFHEDIKFTHEVEKNKSISFLDVKVTRKNDGHFITEVYRKKTDTNLYINWKSFSPKSWKIGTLKGLFRRAYVICSEKSGLDREIAHLKHVFTKVNGYPSKVVYNTLQEVTKTIEKENNVVNVIPGNENNNVENSECSGKEIFPHMCLPYKGPEGEEVINRLKGYLSKVLPKEIKPRFIYKGKKLGSFFKVKDSIKKEHLSDLVYGYFRHITPNLAHYVGETNVRYGSRTYEHSFTDKQSAIFKDSKANNYVISLNDFRVIETGFNSTIDRKLAEALYINELKPSLNEQVRSYKLKLFN